MADETQQDTTQHDDVATEAAPETGAEFSTADGAGGPDAADGDVQPLPAEDASTGDATAVDAGAADSAAGTQGEGENAAPAPDAEDTGFAAGTDPVAGPAATSAGEPVVAGFDPEPAGDAPDAEPAAGDEHQPDGAADVPAPAGDDAAPAAAAPADAGADAEPAAPAPVAEGGAVDAPKTDDPAFGGDAVELPYNCTGMAKLGTGGHESGGPEQHPAPATLPAPIDPTTGEQLGEEDHKKVTNGAEYKVALARKEEPEEGDVGGAPVSHPAPARIPRPIDPTTGCEVSEEQHELLTGGLHKGDEAPLPESFEEGDK